MLLPLYSYAQEFDVVRLKSHVPGLNISLLHRPPVETAPHPPVLFLHGSSFPSALAFGFRMNGISWMDHLAAHHYDSYALDFLGYGNADRYPSMSGAVTGVPTGRAEDVYKDVDSAVNYILQKTRSRKVYLIAHSWGGSVAALYASKFPDKIDRLVLFGAITAKEAHVGRKLVQRAYDSLTPEDRVNSMIGLTPQGEKCQLEAEVLTRWKTAWLQSDPLANTIEGAVRFPSGPSQDVEDITHGSPYYDPAQVKVPVLLIRGEWDEYPSNEDTGLLLKQLTNAPLKKYVVIGKGTHVMHLEKSRFRLYQEVLNFLSDQ